MLPLAELKQICYGIQHVILWLQWIEIFPQNFDPREQHMYMRAPTLKHNNCRMLWKSSHLSLLIYPIKLAYILMSRDTK